MIAAIIEILVKIRDQASKAMDKLGDKIRFAGARMRNAGIGLMISMAPVALALRHMVGSALEYEAVGRSIGQVSTATGRDIAEVMSIIEKHSGQMSSKLDVTRGMLKLLSTELSTTEIDRFIQLIKDGASAMGEDFGTQLALVSRGFKQLNPNVIDNIGINIRMRDIYKKAGKELKTSTKMLYAAIDASGDMNDAQKDALITQVLFTEMERKGSIYTGVYANYLNSTAGSVAKLNAKLVDLSTSLGTYLLPDVQKMSDGMTVLIEKFDELPEKTKKNITRLAAFGGTTGFAAGILFMFVGNLVWSIGQLHLFATKIWVARGAILGFGVALAPIAAVALLVAGAFLAYHDVLLRLRTVITRLRGLFLNLSVILIRQSSGTITKLLNKYVEFQNVLAGVGDTIMKLIKSDIRFQKLQKVGEKDTLAYTDALEKEAEALYAKANAQDQERKDWEQRMLGYVGLGKEKEGGFTPANWGDEPAAAAQGVSGGSTQYGDVNYYIITEGGAGLGGIYNMEQIQAYIDANVKSESVS